ncbi:MAG TPA: hypothetical protein VFC46_10395, partial [Humisphaera sp.]|nr:hypothetical protein [Humisphaera sp.]
MRNTTFQNGWRVALPKCAIAAAMLCLAHAADAGFIISSSRYADGADDVVVFRALNDGAGSQMGTTKVGSENITVTSKVSALIFDLTQDIDGDSINDSNVLGIGD